MSDQTQDREAVERAARALAGLTTDEPWPTNETLGGNPTGTRDDEYRAAMFDQADAALSAAGWDEMRAEVERLRGVESGWQHDRSEWEAERNAALARATSAEQERDDARQQVAGLRAEIYDAAARAEAETRFRVDVSRPDTVERDRQVFQEGVWWARAVLRALAETGQPGEEHREGEQEPPFWRDLSSGKPCPRSGPVLCTITDPDHLHRAIHMDRPAPVVPDSAGLRERLAENWRVFKKHSPAGAYLSVGQMDGDCRECGGAWPCAAVLAVVGQGVSADAQTIPHKSRCGCDLSGMTPPAVHLVDNHDDMPCPRCGGDWLRPDFTGSGRCHAPRTTYNLTGQEPTTRGAGA